MSEAKKSNQPETTQEQVEQKTEKNGMGEIRISSEVVSVIASNAALEVDGIANLGGGIAGNISQVLGRKNPFKGIKVEIDENRDVNIDLHIVVEYGARIPDVAWKIQERIKNNVEQMTGLHVEEINIHVQGVSFDKDTKKAEKLEKNVPETEINDHLEE